MSIFNDKSLKSVADAALKVMEQTAPKTEKEKDLAALSHPKDKITHKDVLVGRGVLKKEETEQAAEQIDEVSKKTLASYVTKAKDQIHRTAYHMGKEDASSKPFSAYNRKVEKVSDKRHAGVEKAVKKLAKEDFTPSFSDLVESYANGGLKGFFENFDVIEEVIEEEATNAEFVSELEKAKRKAAGTEKNEVAKAAVQAVQNEEAEQIEEAENPLTKNPYQLYNSHKNFDKAHNEIDHAVKNAHKDPAGVKRAMKKHSDVGAEDSESRDLIHAKIKKLHGADVAKQTKTTLWDY
jgi:hypothetical protein